MLPRLTDELETIELRIVELLGLQKQLKLRIAHIEAARLHTITRQEQTVLKVLRIAGTRLPLSGVIAGLASLGRHWHERTVKRYLKSLTNQQLINNDPLANPPGYGLVSSDTNPSNPATCGH